MEIASSEIFFELHRGLPQQGPGSEASTLRALKFLPNLGKQPRILDIGCGPGRQSLTLAQATRGTLVTVDTHEPFLNELEDRAEAAGITNRITTMAAPMESLELEPASFNLIWSEGAAYLMGFEKALRAWARFLKPGGFLCVSEACWLKSNPPAELKAFWSQGYPAMTDVEGNARILTECGYRKLGHFILPESDWWQYYRPIQERLPEFQKRYASDSQALKVLDEEQFEIELYQRFKDWYGYVFFSAQLGN